MDSLEIEKAILAGFDWGARTANIIAALWPERCQALVSVSGYLIGSQAAGKTPLPPPAELQWWYQLYFATERGRQGTTGTDMSLRSSFGRSLRQNGSLTMQRSIARQGRSTIRIMWTSSFTTIAGVSDSRTAKRNTTTLEKRLAQAPVITVPTITLEGDANGARISGPKLLCKEIYGHIRPPDDNGGSRAHLPLEAPEAFAGAVIDVTGL